MKTSRLRKEPSWPFAKSPSLVLPAAPAKLAFRVGGVLV
jgi:hypothetical protein